MTVTTRQFEALDTFDVSKLAGSTLVIPSISIGNVPQLSVDLLLHTYESKIIGSLDSIYLYPFASPIDAPPNAKGDTDGISSALDVYFVEDSNITVIQQRSPILPGFVESYVSEVISPFIASNEFAKILILDSSDAGLAEQYSHGKIEYYTTEDLLNNSLGSLNISKKDAIPLTSSAGQEHRQSLYVARLIRASDSINVSVDNKIDISVLISYVYEGDNFEDGEALANKTNSILDLESVSQWIKPLSWLGAYGDRPVPNAMEEGLFG